MHLGGNDNEKAMKLYGDSKALGTYEQLINSINRDWILQQSERRVSMGL